MLLSLNSKVEIKEISNVNIKKDFHLHIRTRLKQAACSKSYEGFSALRRVKLFLLKIRIILGALFVRREGTEPIRIPFTW